MLSPLHVSSSVTSPLPADFTVRPLVRNFCMSRIASHRLFYPSFLFLGVLFIVYAAIPWNDSLVGAQWTFFVICQLLAWSWCSVALTQVDRRIMWMLLRTFEYIFLVSQALTISICVVIQSPSAFTAFWALGMFGGFTFMLSFDAFLGASRLGKGCALLAFLAELLYILAYNHAHPTDDPQYISVFFYRTTVDSMMGSAYLTLTLFVGKYLFYILCRPGRMLILASNVTFSVMQDPTFESSDVAFRRGGELKPALMDTAIEE
jgi:hypothetical protein